MFTTSAARDALAFDPAEWGPGSHNPENPTSFEATRAALDVRDLFGERPDDN